MALDFLMGTFTAQQAQKYREEDVKQRGEMAQTHEEELMKNVQQREPRKGG